MKEINAPGSWWRALLLLIVIIDAGATSAFALCSAVY